MKTITTVPVVYFDMVTVPELDRPPVIKIGETGNHCKRRNEHAKSKHGVEFKVDHLCVVRGTRADEQQVLRYFAKFKLNNEEETFNLHEELIDYIRWLRDQYFVWIPDCKQCLPIEMLDSIEATLWMPRQDRRKKGPEQADLFTDFGPLNLPPRELTIDDFYTNPIIISAARKTLGGIDLDPASHSMANAVVQAKRFFSIHDNGLTREWAGRVWLNPPFSQWQDWVPKIISEWLSGRIDSMCILCATRTLTAQYFAPIHEYCSAICILRGRIPFWGGRATTPDDGHAVFYFGDDAEAFSLSFSSIGFVTHPIKRVTA